MSCAGRHPTPILKLRLLLFLSFVVFSLSFQVSAGGVRVLKVKIAAALEFKASGMWKVEMCKMIRDISGRLRSRFGIAFKATEVDFWQPEAGSKPLVDHLRDLIKKVPRGDCHLVIGIIPSSISEMPPFGAADYLQAYVLLRDNPIKSGLTDVLEHELCHIFGAVDLEENGSIMDITRRGGRYDAFTMAIMTMNRNRSFTVGQFPLPSDLIDKVVALYRKRLGREGEATDARKLEEMELQTVLRHLEKERSGRSI